ncbi:hypothetical protein CKO14_05420 [Halorhodospira halophila]|nr:hypothetical protein [Halorhodospira halophila]
MKISTSVLAYPFMTSASSPSDQWSFRDRISSQAYQVEALDYAPGSNGVMLLCRFERLVEIVRILC